jgi:hypothetical protein
MYRVRGSGYAGAGQIPVAVDYTVSAADRDDALQKVRQLGITVISCTVTAPTPDLQDASA